MRYSYKQSTVHCFLYKLEMMGKVCMYVCFIYPVNGRCMGWNKVCCCTGVYTEIGCELFQRDNLISLTRSFQYIQLSQLFKTDNLLCSKTKYILKTFLRLQVLSTLEKSSASFAMVQNSPNFAFLRSSPALRIKVTLGFAATLYKSSVNISS